MSEIGPKAKLTNATCSKFFCASVKEIERGQRRCRSTARGVKTYIRRTLKSFEDFLIDLLSEGPQLHNIGGGVEILHHDMNCILQYIRKQHLVSTWRPVGVQKLSS
jgi:hypothetical protein